MQIARASFPLCYMAIDKSHSRGGRPLSPARGNFAGLLRSARLDRGLTQAQLAAAVDRTQRVISRWEQGRIRAISSAELGKLARALNLEWQELSRAYRADPAAQLAASPALEWEAETSERRLPEMLDARLLREQALQQGKSLNRAAPLPAGAAELEPAPEGLTFDEWQRTHYRAAQTLREAIAGGASARAEEAMTLFEKLSDDVQGRQREYQEALAICIYILTGEEEQARRFLARDPQEIRREAER